MKFLLLILFLIFSPITVQAKEPVHVTYALYAGGMHVVNIEGQYTMTPDGDYALTMDLKTRGLLGALAPWSGLIESNGINHKPKNHKFASTWRGETETTLFDFDEKGVLKTRTLIKENGQKENKLPPKEVHEDGAIDMLSALYRVMKDNETNNNCESTQAVMDGKRRFDMVFKSKGSDDINNKRYTAYQGSANVCEVEIVPVAGKWRDKPRGWMSIQGQAKKNGQLPRIWFAKAHKDLPPIPVKFFIKTNYGALVMHISDIK